MRPFALHIPGRPLGVLGRGAQTEEGSGVGHPGKVWQRAAVRAGRL